MTAAAAAALIGWGSWRVVRLVGPDGPVAAVALLVGVALAQVVVGVTIAATVFDLDPITLVGTAGLIVLIDLLTTVRGVRVPRPPGPGARSPATGVLAGLAVGSVLAVVVLAVSLGAEKSQAFGSQVDRITVWADVGRPAAGAFDDLRRPGASDAVLAGSAALGGRPAAAGATAAFLLAVGAAAAWHLTALRLAPGVVAVGGFWTVGLGSLALVWSPVTARIFLVVGAGTLVALAVEHARMLRPRWRARRAVTRGESQPWGAGSGRLVLDLRRLSVRSDRTASTAVVVLLLLAAVGVAPLSLIGAPLVAAGWRRVHALASRRGSSSGASSNGGAFGRGFPGLHPPESGVEAVGVR